MYLQTEKSAEERRNTPLPKDSEGRSLLPDKKQVPFAQSIEDALDDPTQFATTPAAALVLVVIVLIASLSR
jgi:hypothetical protein